jgi:hypothetical protein
MTKLSLLFDPRQLAGVFAAADAMSSLPEIAEGVIALGTLEMQDGVDEDYFVVTRSCVGRGQRADGLARWAVPWVARHLKQHVALVASGIQIGYARVFAAYILRNWRGVSIKLAGLVLAAAAVGKECEIPTSLTRDVSPVALHSLRWRPPALDQRVFRVSRSGWSGLKSPQSVARTVQLLSSESQLQIGSSRLEKMGENAAKCGSDRSEE